MRITRNIIGMYRAVAVAIACAGLLGCESDPSSGGPGADAVADAQTDGDDPNAGPDAGPDAAPDAGGEVDDASPTDTASDAGDAPLLDAEDAPDSAPNDVDAGDDAGPDAGPDDAGPDDAGPDATCTDTCPAAGASECAGDGARSCATDPATGCLAWGEIIACDVASTCEQGECLIACEDECTAGTTCSPDGASIVTCADSDGDPCLDAEAVACPADTACEQGACVATCDDDCTTGLQECVGGTTIRTCGNTDSDPCAEWGAAVACPGGAACSAGACASPCVNDCAPSGTTECAGDSVRTCGQHDADACLEWSVSVACESWQVCGGGACVLGPPPAAVLINEALVDATGGDGSAGTTVFVELWGPAGQSLDGFSLVGVNGASGDDYKEIAFEGHTIGSDGFFVVAHPEGAAPTKAVADLLDERVDYQNGPDSLQIRWHGVTVDALGYGTFGAGDVFAGEGSPAGSAPAGQSLSRDAQHKDTGDNAADFTVGDASAGLAVPPCSDACPTGGATECAGAAVITCGNHDSDPCLEWSAPVACAAGLECTDDDTGCDFPWLANYLWNVHAGDKSNDWTTAIATDDAGNIYAGGVFQGPFMLGDTQMEYGNTDIFLTRVSPTGEVVWARDIGTGFVEQLEDLTIDSQGDLVLTGWFQGSTNIGGIPLTGVSGTWEVFVAKYTTDGAVIWAKALSGQGSNSGNAVATDTSGNIYLAGSFTQGLSLGGSSLFAVGDDGFVARLDSEGAPEWSFKIGGAKTDSARGITVDPEGNVAVTGTVGSLVDFDPGPAEKLGIGLYVAKYTSAGKYLWHMTTGGYGHRITADSKGDFYVTGVITGSANLGGGTHSYAGGNTDGILMKVSKNGAYMWSTHIGSKGADAIRDVAIDPLGSVLVTGDYGGKLTWKGTPLAFAGTDGAMNQEDAFVAKLSAKGDLAWVSRFGGPGQEWGQALASSPTGHVAWGGHFGSTVKINDDTMTSKGAGDLAVMRFAGTADGLPGCYGAELCSGNGACQDIPEMPLCACDIGYQGSDCGGCAPGFALDGDGACRSVCELSDLACPARSHCEAKGGAASCVCDVGRTGADCSACAPGYYDPKKCFGVPCACVPDCGALAAPGVCDTCAGALELWPGEGSLTGFLVGDKGDATGGCGGAGPDHAIRFELTETTRVELTLSTSNAIVYIRSTCDSPMAQLACNAGQGGGPAKVTEILPPGAYTLWVDSQDGTASSYTLGYSFRTDPCVGVSCNGDLVCTTTDWLATTCACPTGTKPKAGEPNGCEAILPPLKLAVNVDVSNTCDLSVDPLYLMVPEGRVASITYTNESNDYHIDVFTEPGVDTFSLPQGESWTDLKPWCQDGISGYADISASEGCSTTHRLFITCL